MLHLNRWDFFLYNALYVAWHTKEIWAFSDLVAAIFAALPKNFVKMQIICCIYKDFVGRLKAFLPSFCHLCGCEMSPGWGHLITWTDPSVGHLNSILARVAGNLNNNFRKSQMPGGLPGGLPGGGMLKLRFDRYIMGRREQENRKWKAAAKSQNRRKTGQIQQPKLLRNAMMISFQINMRFARYAPQSLQWAVNVKEVRVL